MPLRCYQHPEARLNLYKRLNMAENNSKANKAFAQTEREQIRELFKARANSPPIPDPFNAQSMQEWEEYVIEMRELEAHLIAAGGSL